MRCFLVLLTIAFLTSAAIAGGFLFWTVLVKGGLGCDFMFAKISNSKSYNLAVRVFPLYILVDKWKYRCHIGGKYGISSSIS